MNRKDAAKAWIVTFLVVSLLSNPILLPAPDKGGAYAQGVTLRVSAAQDPAQQNHFFGPQIVQITIDDPGARNPDSSTSGLSVKGESMERVHLADGMWYALIAERSAFLLFLDLVTDGSRDGSIAVSDADDSDNSNSVGGFSIQFGKADSFVREITEIGGKAYVEVKKDAIFPSLPITFTNAANPDIDINQSAEPAPAGTDWPYIRLFNVQENEIVSVGHGGISLSLTYASLPSYTKISLDRGSYPTNSEIIVRFSDFMWNINPVEEDVVSFVLDSSGKPNRVIYQPLRNFNPDTSTAENFPDILPALQNLEFDARQVLEVDAPEGIGALKFTEAFDSSHGRIVTFAAEPFVRQASNARTLAEFTGLALPIYVGSTQVGTSDASDLPVITFVENGPNTSLFETADDSAGGRSNIFAGASDRVVSFDYFNLIGTASTGLSDASASTDSDAYDSGDRATFTVTDSDLNTNTSVSEALDGVESRAFILVGSPFPLANNPRFSTLPKDSGGSFTSNSIRSADFQAGACAGTVVEQVNFPGSTFSACTSDVTSDVEDLSPASTELLALDFTASAIGATTDLPTGFIVRSDVKLADIDDTTTFTMTKAEMLEKADPFIRAVSKLTPSGGGSFDAASSSSVITVQFPKYSLIQVDLRKLDATFSKVFVEVAAFDGTGEVGTPQFVDFEPFDDEDLDGDVVFDIDPLNAKSGIGSFRILDLLDLLPSGANLSSLTLKVAVVVTNSGNTPQDLAAARQSAVIDVGGLGVVRAETTSKDEIKLDAFENLVYRLALDEQGSNSPKFAGSVDLMTVLHDDTVQGMLRDIVTTGDPLRIWLPSRFVPPDRLAFSYIDTDIGGNIRQVSATFVYETKDAQVAWDSSGYRPNQVATLTVTDRDLNRKPDAVEQYTIPKDGFVYFEFGDKRVDTSCAVGTSDCFANFVESVLRETSANTGIFRAQITIPQTVLLEDGTVLRTIKADLEANYVDVRDASSNVQTFRAKVPLGTAGGTTAPEPEKPTVAESGGKKLELNKQTYHPQERAVITVTSQESNIDKFRSDIVFVGVKRLSTSTGISSYKLVETGANTGIFTGYVELQGASGRDGGTGPRDGTLGIDVGDMIVVSYAGLEVRVPVQYNEGRMLWDKARYAVGDRAQLQVLDGDMNRDADLMEIAHVTITVGKTEARFDLKETGANTGIFAAGITLVETGAVAKARELRVKPGDTITAVYTDDTVPKSSLEAAGTPDNMLRIEASVVVGGPELPGTKSLTQAESKMVDDRGAEVTLAEPGQSYRVESRVQNNVAESFMFEFIVQVRDGQGITQFLEFVTQEVGAMGSVMPSIGWQPEGKGTYTIEIFLWQGLEEPLPLSQVKSIVVAVR